MTIRNLEYLFRPKSIAVLAEPGKHGYYPEVVLRNLTAGGYAGNVTAIDVKKHWLLDIGRPPGIGKLDTVPELAITCTPLEDVPRIVSQLGALGTRAVIVGPARIRPGTDVAGLRTAILDAARPHMVRILGAGSGGVIVPGQKLNASNAPVGVATGKIALVAQSADIAAAVLDRAASQGVGFSTVIHLGNSIDIDLADALDWLAIDPATEAILVQFDHVGNGRKFMSAARAAARNKPVVAIRSPGAETASTATPNCSTDQIYEAAMRRAGWVRIVTLEGLFEAAEALAWVRMPRGENLAILANGRGLGRIAADAFLHEGGRLTEFSPTTRATLAKLLHQSTRLSNPLAMAADTSPELWATALTTVLADPATDAVLTVSSPTAFNNSAEIAQAICAVAARSDLNIFTCWTGGASMLAARQVAAACNVLSFDAPEKATLVFQRVVSYARNRELLAQLPASQRGDFRPDDKLARNAVAESIALGNELMPLRQARRLLQAYRIAAIEPVTVASIENAANVANEIGYPVDLDLTLNHVTQTLAAPLIVPGLRSAEEVRIAARGLRSRVRTEQPTARVSGYRLRPGAPRSGIPPLRLGIADDPVFGPIIYLGLSNTLAHRNSGCAVALPPLNHALAHDLVARAGIIDDVHEEQRAPLESTICDAIVRLSQLLTDIDEVASVELDPLHVEATSVVAVNFRLHLEHHLRRSGFRRFAIRPYPKELETQLDWDGGSLLIRPIRPTDDAALGELISSLDTDDARMRFFGTMRGLPPSQLARFTQIDYDREMALVAVERIVQGNDGNIGSPRLLGEVRVVADPDNHAADFAIVVRSGLKGKGLGRLLLQNIIDYARQRGITELRGETFAENLRMQRLAEQLGFVLSNSSDPGTVNLRLTLQPTGAASR